MRLNKGRLFFHGGVPGLKRGDVIVPGMAEHRYVEGCPCCEAQRRGASPADPATPADWVYATTSRIYARYYASRCVGGDLYRVELLGGIEPSSEDETAFPTWRARRARIDRILERRIILTTKERRHLFKRWGGTDAEFDGMVAEVRGERAGVAFGLGLRYGVPVRWPRGKYNGKRVDGAKVSVHLHLLWWQWKPVLGRGGGEPYFIWLCFSLRAKRSFFDEPEPDWVPIGESPESVCAGGRVRRWGPDVGESLILEVRDGLVQLDDGDGWRLDEMSVGEWEVFRTK